MVSNVILMNSAILTVSDWSSKIRERLISNAVSESLIVQPEDLEVLKIMDKGKQVTLVTCDYRIKPYLRLIVKGELVSPISLIR